MNQTLYLIIISVLFFNINTLKAQQWKSYYKTAQYEYEIENYQVAIEYYVKAKELFLEKYQSIYFRNYAAILKNIGICYTDCGMFSKAESYLKEALAIREKILPQKHPLHAQSYSLLATLYRNQSKYNEAEILYLKAKNLLEQISRKYHPDYASVCQELGVLYENQGFYEQAMILFTETQKIRKKIFGNRHIMYSEACQNLGRLHWRKAEFLAAEAFMIEAKKIIERQYGKSGVSYAQLCNNLALMYIDQQALDKAEYLLSEAKTIDSLILGTQNPSYATICHNLAELYHKKHRYQQAEQLYLEAKNIREKILGKTHYYYALSCNKLGKLYTDKKQFSKAYLLYDEGYKILLNQTQSNFLYLSDYEKGIFFSTFRKQFEDYYAFVLQAKDQIPELTAWLYNIVATTKGFIFQSSEKIRQAILNSGDSTLIEKHELLKAKREHLAYLYSLPTLNKRDTQIKNIEKELNTLEKEISKGSNEYSKIISNHNLINDSLSYWKQIREKLKPNQIVIELIRTLYQTDKNQTQADSVLYLALIVTLDTQHYPSLLVLENGNELEEKYLKIYRENIAHKTTEKEAIIYQYFWGNIAREINAISNSANSENTEKSQRKTILISLDGVYHQINLATLRNPQTNNYLVEELDFQILGSTRDLLRSKESPTQKQDIVLMGFPDYNNESNTININQQSNSKTPKNTILERYKDKISNRSLIDREIVPLPATKIEVENISKILTKEQIKHQVLLEQDASEFNLKKFKNPYILHIATHGFFIEDTKSKENLMLLTHTSKQIQWKTSVLFSSGLLLARAKIALIEGGDGIFTAYEALNLNLENTELVVLSACDTGLGQIVIGEGVYGLQRSFQQAGARSVLMSLWKVEDRATQEFMTEFYKNYFEKKQSKREAFNNTQKTMKQVYKYPYYWGAFVLVGE